MSVFTKEYSSDMKVVGIVKNHTQEIEAKTNLYMHKIEKTMILLLNLSSSQCIHLCTAPIGLKKDKLRPTRSLNFTSN